jgi:hypothetical protein
MHMEETNDQPSAPLRDELDRLTNLYVATSRLHESLDRGEVLRAIQEIIINLLGSEELAVFEVSQDGKALELVDSFGLEPGKFDRIPLGDGSIGKVAKEGQPMVEDAAKKKNELAYRLDEKRLELLQLKRDQQAARRVTDPALERQIAELSEKVKRYVAPPAAPEAPVKGLVQLKKKQSDGTVVPARA